MAKILFATRDVGPSRSLARIATEAVDRAHSVRSFFFQPLADWKQFVAWQPDVVVASPASVDFKDMVDLFVWTKNQGIKLVWLADTYGVYRRPSLGDLRADLIFVPDETEKEKALRYGYTNVVASGVPIWEEFFDTGRYLQREETRKRFRISESEIAVIFLGTKNGAITLQALKGLLDSLQAVPANWVLLPRFHPGDESFKSGFYNEFLAKVPLRWVDTASVKVAEELLLTTDLVISLISTVGIAAACLRRTVIDYLPPFLADVLEEQIGERTWNPAESGATMKAICPESLKTAISVLLTAEGKKLQAAKQIAQYPFLRPGAAAKLIIEEIEKLLK